MHNQLPNLFLAILIFFSLASASGNTIQRGDILSQLRPRAFQAPSPDVNVSTWLPMSRDKHGMNTHSFAFLDAHRRGRYGLSPLKSVQLGQAWYTPIQVGGKTYNLLVDTGSSDTWIAAKDFKCFGESEDVVPQADCAFGPLYKPGREFEPIKNVNFNIFYGDGAFFRGSYGMAKVTLGGITVRQQIALASEAGTVGDGISSGYLGLSYPSITYAFKGTNYSADAPENQLPYNPIFTTMYEQHKIAPVFSMAINRPSIPPNGAPEGYLALGGLAPVSTTGQWARTDIEVPVGGSYYINGSLPYPQLPNQVASLFNPPAVWNESVYGYSVPCDAVVPQIAVKIGSVILPWDKRDLIMPEFPYSGGCVSGINNGQDYQAYTLGATFMRSNLVVYDVGAAEMRIRSRGNY
ncbi:aspartic peptidase domain-containing protein [Rhexocercosporidium sp. MPI-PUGE-AT-0058]|nr:aspartic peptidase domain-containing protein [Rhexocercosporidium sp. MPI-PUGE-AT-0058]